MAGSMQFLRHVLASVPALALVVMGGRSVAALATATETTPGVAARAVLDQYCIGCHNQSLSTAGLELDSLDVTRPDARPEVWERVIAKLRAGSMPPPGMPRPRCGDL